MNFRVSSNVETRSDNVNLKGYRVYLNDKKYVMYYDCGILREIYFMSEFENYFMSCRTDMKTISHYYSQDIFETGYVLIRRYENGIKNQDYIVISSKLTVCAINETYRLYITARENLPNEVSTYLYTDLVTFLNNFNRLGLYKLFSPQEPIA